jgi:MFS family permease
VTLPPEKATSRALRNPNFALFWVAQAISRFGDPITVIALAAITYQMTGSALYTTAAVLVATLPQATFGFFAGAIADAIGFRRAMIAADIARAFLIGAIPLLLGFGAPLAVAYGLVFLAALCGAVFNPARFSLVPALLKPDELVSGNAAVYATDRTVEILGAVAAGLLVASLGVNVFYVDAVTFALSALLMLEVTVEEGPPRRISLDSALRQARGGLRFLRESSVLLANTVFSLLAQLSLPVLNGLLPVLIFRRFGTSAPDQGASLFGFAEAGIAAGAVFGAVVVARLPSSVGKGKLLVWGFAACGASLIAVAVAPTFEMLLLALVVTGITNVLFYVPNIAILQQNTPAEIRGAVVGARISLLSLSWLPIVLVGGALADVVDVAVLIALAGLFTVGVALIGSRLRVLTSVP